MLPSSLVIIKALLQDHQRQIFSPYFSHRIYLSFLVNLTLTDTCLPKFMTLQITSTSAKCQGGILSQLTPRPLEESIRKANKSHHYS